MNVLKLVSFQDQGHNMEDGGRVIVDIVLQWYKFQLIKLRSVWVCPIPLPQKYSCPVPIM